MPYEVASPTTREHLSYSQLRVAATCGEAYRRRYVEDDGQGALTVPAVCGSAFHEAMADFEVALSMAASLHQDPVWAKMVGLLISLTKQNVNEALRQRHVTSEDLFHYGNQDMGVYLRSKIPQWAERYVNYRMLEIERGFAWAIEDDPIKSIEVESLVEVAGHPFLSWIDQVYVDSLGRVVIRDLKTGTPKQGDAMQIEQYRVSLKRSHGIDADYGQLLYVGKGEAYPQIVKFTLSDVDVDRVTGHLLRSVGEHLHMVNGPFTGACGTCEFSPDCPYGQVGIHGVS